jgi:hypothetical protein
MVTERKLTFKMNSVLMIPNADRGLIITLQFCVLGFVPKQHVSLSLSFQSGFFTLVSL